MTTPTAAWLGAALALAGVAPGAPATQSTQATPATQAPDFELPSADGRGFVRLLARPTGPTLVGFRSVDCPHCLVGMATIRDFAQQHPHWRVLMVNTDTPQRLRRRAVSVEAPGTGLRVPGDPRALLRRYGNPDGALPYAIAVDADGLLCSRARGELTARGLREITRSCQGSR